jgi:hypothetical protein
MVINENIKYLFIIIFEIKIILDSYIIINKMNNKSEKKLKLIYLKIMTKWNDI